MPIHRYAHLLLLTETKSLDLIRGYGFLRIPYWRKASKIALISLAFRIFAVKHVTFLPDVRECAGGGQWQRVPAVRLPNLPIRTQYWGGHGMSVAEGWPTDSESN